MRQVPIYLFLGFLESGKTKFIQETLEDERFNTGEKTVILMCEEGIEEYDLSKFKKHNVSIVEIEGEAEITYQKLMEIDIKYEPERIMCEYNGMFLLQTLYNALPNNWDIAQTFMFAHAPTFISYNNNIRQLVFDKLSASDLVAFNRFNDNLDKMEFHKIVRQVARRAEIVYEYDDGKLVPDDIEDPLPFDINADPIVVEEKDYAFWYQDLCEDMNKYHKKNIKIACKLIKDSEMPNGFIMGRDMMNCCANDIQLAGLACRNPKKLEFEDKGWYILTGLIEIRFSDAYGKKGPVISATSLEKIDEPENPIATFY